MSYPLRVIKTVPVTDAILTATDIPETDHAAYAAGTTYTLGQRVIVPSTHEVYESLQATNLGHDPLLEDTWWGRVSATNRWKVFDPSSTSQTVIGTSAYYELTPGQSVDSVALVNVTGLENVRIRVIDPVYGTVFDQTASLLTPPSSATWYAWFFEPRTGQSQFVVTGLPQYPSAKVRVDLESSSTAKVGVLLIGTSKAIGSIVKFGVRLSIQDFSGKERNSFGEVSLIKRGNIKTMSLPIEVDTDQLDDVYGSLAELTGTACLWLGTSLFSALNLYGFINTFDIVVSYATHSELSLELEGLL